jgi:hypothetical protein
MSASGKRDPSTSAAVVPRGRASRGRMAAIAPPSIMCDAGSTVVSVEDDGCSSTAGLAEFEFWPQSHRATKARDESMGVAARRARPDSSAMREPSRRIIGSRIGSIRSRQSARSAGRPIDVPRSYPASSCESACHEALLRASVPLWPNLFGSPPARIMWAAAGTSTSRTGTTSADARERAPRARRRRPASSVGRTLPGRAPGPA